MKRSDELRDSGLQVTNNIEEKIGKMATQDLMLALELGSFAMLTDISASLADISEKLGER